VLAFRKLPLYPNVMILAWQMSGSSGRNVNGQKRSRSLFFDHVKRLVPPRPWTKTMSTLRPPPGLWRTRRPSGSRTEAGLLLRSLGAPG